MTGKPVFPSDQESADPLDMDIKTIKVRGADYNGFAIRIGVKEAGYESDPLLIPEVYRLATYLKEKEALKECLVVFPELGCKGSEHLDRCQSYVPQYELLVLVPHGEAPVTEARAQAAREAFSEWNASRRERCAYYAADAADNTIVEDSFNQLCFWCNAAGDISESWNGKKVAVDVEGRIIDEDVPTDVKRLYNTVWSEQYDFCCNVVEYKDKAYLSFEVSLGEAPFPHQKHEDYLLPALYRLATKMSYVVRSWGGKIFIPTVQDSPFCMAQMYVLLPAFRRSIDLSAEQAAFLSKELSACYDKWADVKPASILIYREQLKDETRTELPQTFVGISYSFDSESPVLPFDTHAEAKRFMETNLSREAAIDRENGWNSVQVMGDEDATLTNIFQDREDVTTWRIGFLDFARPRDFQLPDNDGVK